MEEEEEEEEKEEEEEEMGSERKTPTYQQKINKSRLHKS